MTVQDFMDCIAQDSRINIKKPIKVFDPTKDDYVEATCYAVGSDGSVTLHWPWN